MKNRFSFILILSIICVMLSGCAQIDTQGGAPNVICTTFAAYDWARNIVGDSEGIKLTLLPDGYTDMHSYQASADDIVQISTCDMIVYTGGTSEKWIADALQTNKTATVVNMLALLGERAVTEEHKEGMQEEPEENCEPSEKDEHVWLSLKNAELFCENIAQALSAADPAGAELYSKNAQGYIEKLSALDSRFVACVEEATKHALLFGDRFPFAYLVKDYGLDYYAAFPGCSAETEASFETVVYLAEKTDELGLKYICTIENSQAKIAQTIINNTKNKDQQIICLDSMQSKSVRDINDGETYIKIMEENLDALKSALSCQCAD